MMRKRLVYLLGAFCLQLLIPPVTVHGQDQSSALRGKLLSFSTNMALDSLGIRPWHWLMDVTVYDPNGKTPETGSIEAWFADGNMRTKLKLAGADLTTLRVGNQLYRESGDAKKLVPLEVAFMQALRSVEIDSQELTTRMKLVQQSVGKVKLDCIQPMFKVPEADTFPAGTPLSYCSQEGVDQLLVTYMPGSISITRSRMGHFLGKQVTVGFSVSELSKKRLEVTTSALGTFTPSAEEFAVLPSMQPLVDPIEISSRDQSLGLILLKDPPHYPADAKVRHAQGSVKLDAVIDTDGRLASLQPLNYADPALVEAAQRAIKNWRFRPYLVNGLPVKVKTVITMNFNISS